MAYFIYRFKKSKFLSNVAYAFVAQVIALMASFSISFFLPKVMSVEDFGYWQLFTFYSSYVGFFLLGLNGGIYLIQGGKSRETIDKSLVGSQIRIGIASQLVISIACLMFLHSIEIDASRKNVLYGVIVYLFISNSTDLLTYTFQAINETRLYSQSVMIDKVLLLTSVLASIVFIRIDSFAWYIGLFLCCRFVALLFSIWFGKDFLFSHNCKWNELKNALMQSLSSGLNLMLSSIATMLIMGVARFAVDGHWGIEVFGQFSLAVSLENFFLVFISQFSMVMFPTLRNVRDEARVSGIFIVLRDGLDLVFPAVYLLYIPISVLIAWWIPNYSTAISYFTLLLPICVFDSKMNLVGTTYLKVLRKERQLFIINAVTALISTIGVAISTIALNSIVGVIGSVVVAIMLRSVVCDSLVSRYLACSQSSMRCDTLLLTALYLFVTVCVGGYPSLIILVVAYVVFLLRNKNIISNLLSTAGRA